MSKQWGGRFSKETAQEVEEFTSSLSLDQRLWSVDIQASIAHARMLGKQNIIPQSESEQIIQALRDIHEEFQSGKLSIDFQSEDVHSDVEKKLFQKIGPIAGKLHTARSRNDQVATDLRLFLKKEISFLSEELKKLQKTFFAHAEKNIETILPGVTHLQPAQPVSLAHHLLAYFWMFQRDYDKLTEALKRLDKMPLGSAALAGTSFPIDRHMTAAELNFTFGPTENSLDAVSDRDFVIEFLSIAATIMMHLSRFSEELILWSHPLYSFVELGDEVTTGSSIMPQKKNPDVAELIRGRVGIVYGDLMGALTMLKGLPLSYNRDLQEDKTYLFRSLDTVKACVSAMSLMLSTADWKKEKMKQALSGDFSNATDLADYLVNKNLSFRQAHEVVGKVVQYCLQKKMKLEDITLAELKDMHPAFESDVIQKIQHEAVMWARTSLGGTSPQALEQQLELVRPWL